MQHTEGAHLSSAGRACVRLAGKAKVLASALKDAGIKAGEKVGIYASNSPEWMLCILAANRSSISVGACGCPVGTLA